MKCDELRIENACVYDFDAKVYLAEQVNEAIAELKQFAEDACLERDDNQTAIDELQDENRKLNRALWLARAERAKEFRYKIGFAISSMNTKYDYSDADRWQKVERKCINKAEEYK